MTDFETPLAFVTRLETIASPEGLGRFCALRQSAWLSREQTGLHLSSDPVIAKHHFTNVYRELDPGTQLAARLLHRYRLLKTPATADDPAWRRHRTRLRHQALWTAVAYRCTNRASVWTDYKAMTGPGRFPDMDSEEEWLGYLEDERAAGRRVFTGRHYTMGLRSYAQTLQDVRSLEPAWVDDAFRSAADLTEGVRRLRGVGRFFGWQVTADLVMSGHVPPVPDHVVLGPGACLALAWMRDRRPWAEMFNATGRRTVAAGTHHLGETAGRDAILDLRATQDAWLPSSFLAWNGRRLELVDLEHALCEYARWGVLHHKLAQKKAAA